MIEKIGQAITFYCFYVASKVGKTGITVTIDVYDAAGNLEVSGGSATAVGGGLYKYTLASGSVDAAGEYTAIFKTSDATVDAQQIPALWVVGKPWVENIDATISSRSTLTAQQVWEYTTRTLTSFGTLVTDIWGHSTRTLTSFGTLVADVWGHSSRTLTSLGTLAADVWSHSSRTLTSFGTLVADIWANVTRTLTSWLDP